MTEVVRGFLGVGSEENKDRNERLRFELDLAREHLFNFLSADTIASSAFARLRLEALGSQAASEETKED